MSGQRGGLGISIAGGNDPLPYKESNEGIFIPRVNNGGPVEKAGVYIGDRELEVTGQNMQTEMLHEAVSDMYNAATCIKIKVLQQKVETADSHMSQGVSDTGSLFGCKRTDIEAGLQFNRNENMNCNSKDLIPRIILTHPSTSDEDVEGLTHGVDDSDDHISSDQNNAFYPP